MGLNEGPDGRLLLYGIRGWIAESLDRGETWRQLDADMHSSVFDAEFLPDGRAVLVGAAGNIRVEAAAGNGSFRAVYNEHRGTISKVLIRSTDTLLLFGEDGVYEITISESDGSKHE